VFVAIASCISIRAANTSPWLMFLMCFSGMAAFYVAHWRTYVTGSLTFGKYVAGDVEAGNNNWNKDDFYFLYY
jgi:hypothetical protein